MQPRLDEDGSGRHGLILETAESLVKELTEAVAALDEAATYMAERYPS